MFDVVAPLAHPQTSREPKTLETPTLYSTINQVALKYGSVATTYREHLKE